MEADLTGTSPVPMRWAPRMNRPVCSLGWGAFKIGRNEGVKYPVGYELPTDAQATKLVHDIIGLGVRVIDTAPAYGSSEVRVGNALASLDPSLRAEIFLSTKAGESFAAGVSTYDFSACAIERSVRASLDRLQSPKLDIVWIHSDGNDCAILRDGGAVSALTRMRESGLLGAVGFSPKTVEGALAALDDPRIDGLMVEYHPRAVEFAPVIARASESQRGVFIKKPLASGVLDPSVSLPWILANPGVTCVVVGGLSLERLSANLQIARDIGS